MRVESRKTFIAELVAFGYSLLQDNWMCLENEFSIPFSDGRKCSHFDGFYFRLEE